MEENKGLEDNQVYFDELPGAPAGAPAGAEEFHVKRIEQPGGEGTDASTAGAHNRRGGELNGLIERESESRWPLTVTHTQLRALALSNEIAQDYTTKNLVSSLIIEL